MSQDWIRQIEDDNRWMRDEAVKTDAALKKAVELMSELHHNTAAMLMHMNDEGDDWSAMMALKETLDKISAFITAHPAKANENGHKPDVAELEERLGVANQALELVDEKIRPMISRMAFLYGDGIAVEIANQLTPLLNRWRSYLHREAEHE